MDKGGKICYNGYVSGSFKPKSAKKLRVKPGFSFLFDMLTTPITHRELLSFTKTILVVAVFLAIATPAVTVLAKMSETSIIDLVNASRKEAGLSPLSENAKLQAAAEAKADDMFKHDYFSHTSPSGKTPWTWVKESGYTYKAAGENLAINYTDAEEQHRAWMKSPTHKANILNTRYQEIGVATKSGSLSGKQATVTVQMFGTPLSAIVNKPATTTPTEPTPATTPTVQGLELILPVQMNSPEANAALATPPVLMPKTQNAVLAWMQIIAIFAVALILSLSPLLFLFQSIRSLTHGFHVHRHQVPLG